MTRSFSPQTSSVGTSMRCSQIRQLRIVQTRVPGEPRQPGAVLQDDVDVELGLRLPATLRRACRSWNWRRANSSAPPGEDVVERRLRALRARRRQQRQRGEPLRVADRHLGRDPAADAMADEMHVAQIQRLQHVEIEEREIADVSSSRRGIGERPKPGCSGAMTRCCALSASSSGDQVSPSAPCRKSTGGPVAGFQIPQLGAGDLDGLVIGSSGHRGDLSRTGMSATAQLRHRRGCATLPGERYRAGRRAAETPHRPARRTQNERRTPGRLR